MTDQGSKADRRIAAALLNYGFDGTETELNRQALAALHGYSSQPERDLRDLFQSSDPIHWVIRAALADAFNGETLHGTLLKLEKGGATRDMVIGLESRKKRLAIGLWIDDARSNGRTKEKAIEDAAQHFTSTFDTCESAYKYAKRCAKFVAEELEGGSSIAKHGQAAIETVFHMIDHREGREKRGRKKRGGNA